MAKDTSRLRALLAEERFPLQYMHKFIGRNTPAFTSAVVALETRFPRATRVSVRESGANQTYVAYTYSLDAQHVDEIVELWTATSELKDLTLIL